VAPKADPGPDPVVLPVPEIRDYREINARLALALDAGARHVRLEGVEGQRLLVHGLRGAWDALVEVEGRAGPELASALDAPGLRVVCLGDADAGAGLGLVAGRLLILGDAGDALGYAQRGGSILAARLARHRAGLDQSGGLLAIRRPAGRLVGERQSGGRLVLLDAEVGPHLGLGRRGGRLLAPFGAAPGLDPIGPADADAFRGALDGLEPFLPADFPRDLGPAKMDNG
jgi:glutamate synthase domain-containing protein 3